MLDQPGDELIMLEAVLNAFQDFEELELKRSKNRQKNRERHKRQ